MCACIDKTYLSYKDYLTLKDWCKQTKLIYANNKEGSPMDFLLLYNEPYEGEAPVWNTSESFDRWLYFNCPLPFIQERLKEQYGNPDEYFNKSIIKLESGTRYIQLTKPKFKWRGACTIDICFDWDFLYYYNKSDNNWYDYGELLSPYDNLFIGYAHIKNITKRKLNRLIKKWKLPIGTILNISNIYLGSDYKIKIIK